MTSAAKRQVALLALLGIVLIGAVQWQRSRTATADSVAPAARPRAARANGAATGQVADLRLERLKAIDGEIAAPTRNPFRFQPKPPPPAPAPRVAPPPPVVPTGPPPPPPIPLKFIGLLDAPARIGRIAILSDSRGGVFYGKEGDIIDGRYQLLRIGPDSADLAYADGRGRQTLRLSGQ